MTEQFLSIVFNIINSNLTYKKTVSRNNYNDTPDLMSPVRQIGNDAKGKVKPLFLKDILAGKLGRKKGKKGRRSALIFEFTPSMPPVMNTQFGNWQVSFNRAIYSTAFQVLAERFGYNNSCLCRPWTDVHWPNDHPNVDRILLFVVPNQWTKTKHASN